VLIKGRVVLAPVSKFRIVLTACRDFMGANKPSSIELLCRTTPPYSKVILWRENEVV
jgi:hypothetical protein